MLKQPFAVVPLLLGICLSLPVAAQLPPGDGSKIEILMPGLVFPDELNAKAGEDWWVLFQAVGEDARLRYAPIEVTKLSQDSPYHRLSAMGFPDNEVILLFRGTKELPRGPVSSVFNGYLSLAPGTEIYLQDFAIQVQPFKSVDISGAPVKLPATGDYEIRIVQQEATKQVLFKANWDNNPTGSHSFNDRLPALLWAGDLDKDHKLDLLLDVSMHYAAPSYALFLSSYAQGDELVHLVAEYHGAGC